MPRVPRITRTLVALALAGAAAPYSRADYDAFADALAENLRVSSPSGLVRAGLRGRADFSVYGEREATADLRYSEDRFLFTPEFRLFGDAQVGDAVYGFVQLAADRGFDPGREPMEARVDEFVLRLSTPDTGGLRASVQVGRFSTVFGGWSRRHLNWENPFATAPLAHENLVGLWDSKGAPASSKPAAWAHINPLGDSATIISDERNRIPVVWGPVYTTGLSLVLTGTRHELAFEVKNSGLSSRPSTWDDTDAARWDYPALATRIGWRPAVGWDLGVSAAHGIYLDPKPVSLYPGANRDDYRQTTFGTDLAYEWRQLLLWAEIVAARFEVPGAGDADTLAASLEARYKFGVRIAAALRLDWQGFHDISTPAGEVPWGREVWRVEAGPVLRLAAQAQLKLLASLRHENDSPEAWNPGFSGQLSLRF